MSARLHPTIERDLGRKLSDDVGACIRRTVSLCADPRDAFGVSLYAAAASLGCLASFGKMIGEPLAAEQQVDELWTILRPMVLLGLGGSGDDFAALLDRAPLERSA